MWVDIQEGTKALEIDGIGVIIGVPGALLLVQGAALSGTKVVKAQKSANVPEQDPFGLDAEKGEFPQDEDYPF